LSGWPWNVGALPFYYTPLRRPTNDDLPDRLPFALDTDYRTGTLVQVPNKEVSDALSQAYSKGSMPTGMMDEEGIGKEYAEDFLAFLQRRADACSKRVSVLEIGCGTGYLLYRLKLLGADVLGLEPGPHGQHGSKRFGIPIIKDFFPSPKIAGEFDLVVLFSVLEHMESPSAFLGSVLPLLKENGRIAISIPDCEPYMGAGDISMLYPEHFSYYTQTTLRNSVKASMGLETEIEKASFGGTLYALGKGRASRQTVSETELDAERQRANNYRILARKGIGRLLGYLKDAAVKGESVGIYAPARAINALSIIREEIDLKGIRFFDDNPALRDTYFPGFSVPIEPGERLMEKPTDRILIMSRSFGKRIAKHVMSLTIDREFTITTWEELFAG